MKMFLEYMFSTKSFIDLHSMIQLFNFSCSAYWVHLSNYIKISFAALESNIIVTTATVQIMGL